ncbi:MAG: hypothetical protein NVSMB14_07550 [Isosphaeraceae bacterium]
MGIGSDELVHVRRGALLHDIGKIGIPDAILLKPGPLDEVEWSVMRTHPGLAVEILRPIDYLKPALGIPYCHHEKWDGSGYPRGLQGEEIPLEARIFAAIDIWDALGHDRPYRRAWPRERVIDHIREASGTHLDPRVVEAFLDMITKPSARKVKARKIASIPGPIATDPAEQARLASLRRYEILDTPAEPCYDDIVLLASHICGSPIALVSLVDATRQWFKAKHGLDAFETSRDVSFCAHAIRGDDLFVVPDASLDTRFASNPLVTGSPNIRFYAGMPLIVPDGAALGTLCVIDCSPRIGLSPDQEHALRALAREVVSQLELRRQAFDLERASRSRRALEAQLADQLRKAHELNVQLEIQHRDLAQANDRLVEMAATDPLTGLKNRRFFHQVLDGACAAVAAPAGNTRSKVSEFSLIMVDIDYFKRLNDTLGHQAGDDALRRVAGLLRGGLRNGDVIARFGGEEFVVLLPNTQSKTARLVAERLRGVVADADTDGSQGPITVSLGISTSTQGVDASTMIERADQALYHSKRSGRDRVTHFDDLSCRSDPIAFREVG